MPFWKDYVEAKPEVDDDDLPLPEHRIFDDEGYIKDKVTQAVAAALRTSPPRATNAKKSPALSPKKRAELLKSVGAKPTTPLKVTEAGTKAPAASSHTSSRSPSARKSATRSPAARAKSPAATPTSPRASRGDSAARKPTPKKASPKKASAKPASSAKSTPSRSPARRRARSPSPTKPKPSPKAASRAKRSRSKSGSRKAAPSKTPSPKWTVSALKDFAKENAIGLHGATKKADILVAIKKSA